MGNTSSYDALEIGKHVTDILGDDIQFTDTSKFSQSVCGKPGVVQGLRGACGQEWCERKISQCILKPAAVLEYLDRILEQYSTHEGRKGIISANTLAKQAGIVVVKMLYDATPLAILFAPDETRQEQCKQEDSASSLDCFLINVHRKIVRLSRKIQNSVDLVLWIHELKAIVEKYETQFFNKMEKWDDEDNHGWFVKAQKEYVNGYIQRAQDLATSQQTQSLLLSLVFYYCVLNVVVPMILAGAGIQMGVLGATTVKLTGSAARCLTTISTTSVQDVLSFGFDYDDMLERLKHLPVIVGAIQRTTSLKAGGKKLTIRDFVRLVGENMGVSTDAAMQLFTKMFHTVKTYLTSGGMMVNYGKIALQLMGYNMC
jgi:hypothetical protein